MNRRKIKTKLIAAYDMYLTVERTDTMIYNTTRPEFPTDIFIPTGTVLDDCDVLVTGVDKIMAVYVNYQDVTYITDKTGFFHIYSEAAKIDFDTMREVREKIKEYTQKLEDLERTLNMYEHHTSTLQYKDLVEK